MNGIPPYGPDPVQKTDDRKAIAIVIIAVCVAVIVALTVLFFTGVIRFGTPRAYALSTTASVDNRQRPTSKTSSFDGDTKRVYCCARLQAFEDTVLVARWYLGASQIGGFNGRFGAIAHSAAGRFLTRTGNVAFYLERPPSGWLSGDYTVMVYVNGKRAASKVFTINVEGQAATSATYTDPQGRFKVDVPNGWAAADQQSQQGVLAGFVSAGGQYPPRFAITETSYDSVDATHLNANVANTDQTAQFQPYSLGSSVAARRDYGWDYVSGNSKLKLHTVQVVVQGKGKIYGIDCHSLASDYNKNLPQFNAIINSFRPS
jgi:hypothetical protein